LLTSVTNLLFDISGEIKEEEEEKKEEEILTISFEDFSTCQS